MYPKNKQEVTEFRKKKELKEIKAEKRRIQRRNIGFKERKKGKEKEEGKH